MRDGMAGRAGNSELRNDVPWIDRRYRPYRQVTVGGGHHYLPRAASMASKTVFILVDRGIQHGNAIDRANPLDASLRRPQHRRRQKRSYLQGSMCIVAVHAGRMAVLIQNRRLCRVMQTSRSGERMARFGKLRKHIEGSRGNVTSRAVTRGAVIFVLAPQQARRSRRIVHHVAGGAAIQGDRRIGSQAYPGLAGDFITGRGVDTVRPSG